MLGSGLGFMLAVDCKSSCWGQARVHMLAVAKSSPTLYERVVFLLWIQSSLLSVVQSALPVISEDVLECT